MPTGTTRVMPAKGRDGWDVQHRGRIVDHTDRQEEAIEKARRMSQEDRTELEIREKDSHGHDPYPPEG